MLKTAARLTCLLLPSPSQGKTNTKHSENLSSPHASACTRWAPSPEHEACLPAGLPTGEGAAGVTQGGREPGGGHGAVQGSQPARLCQRSSRTRAHAFEATIKERKAAYLWFLCVQVLKGGGEKKRTSVAVDTAVESLKDTDRLAKPEAAERPEQTVYIRCAR